MRRKDLIELGITGILAVALIIAFGSAVKKARSRNIVPKTAGSAGVSPADKIESRDLYNYLEQETGSIELKRDPFTSSPIISYKNVQSGLALTGILWDKLKPLAIIDGEVVKKGDRIGNKEVVDIKRDRVILSDGQEFFEVKLEP
ncbi:MAG: hypothetical protein PHT50_00860 [Candidatus Omnitrophica bacterium]|nr:hypothetical protein [Candidatus Omnitrophota bacterium]